MTIQQTAVQEASAQSVGIPSACPRPFPEYLEAEEVNALIRASPNSRAALLLLVQWRVGLRVSEALALEVRDLSLDSGLPTIHVRRGQGGKAQDRAGPPRTSLRAIQLTAVQERRAMGQIHRHRGVQIDRRTNGYGLQRLELGRPVLFRPAYFEPYVAAFIRPASAGEWETDQRSHWLPHSIIQTILIHFSSPPTVHLVVVP